MQSKIAVCLIAGNEKALIGRALDSAFLVSDLVVVVQATGGAQPDGTMDVARSRGCIVGQYHNNPATAAWPFVDDFAAARNESFRLALQTDAQWLMWMDCDDVISHEHAKAIRQAVERCQEDWILAEYDLPMHGKKVWRERLFRRGTAAWANGVHEKCVPVCNDGTQNSIKVRVCRDFVIRHEPLENKSGSQERNINIMLWCYQEAQHLAFYLHYEHFLLKKHEEAVKYGLEALRMEQLDGVYRYEVMLNLAVLASENANGQDILQKAIKICPTRREAYHILSLLQMDAGQTQDAVETALKCRQIVAPKVPEWTHRPDVYGWKSEAALAWAYRCDGKNDKAAVIEAELLELSDKPRITLLHATRGRWAKAIGTMTEWINRASDPFRVEHFFAVDEDDVESLEKLRRFRHVVSKASTYSVGAWNRAAEAATGEILVQIADDFEPMLQWDEAIVSALGAQINEAKVLRVNDGVRKDGLITAAVVTRAWYDKEGVLFDPAFRNVYSDNDLTMRAQKANAIIEAPHILFKHRHPIADASVPVDATYERGNDIAEYKRAKELYDTKHKLV